MNIQEVAAHTGWQIAVESQLDPKVEGVFVGDLLSWVMGHARPGDLWVTVQAHANIVAVASLRELAGIVIAHGSEIEEETLQSAKDEGVMILRTPQSAADCVKALATLGI
ncbi:MAG: DRTGG domain-containing protein [Erysipelotrichaceae bacterium]